MSNLNWDQVRAIARRSVEGLAARDIPNAPGVYVWFREGDPVYVGEARGAGGLRGRLRAHLATGVDLSRSTLRASVAVNELGISRAHARGRPSLVTPDQVEVVNRWLRSCDLGWVACDTAESAHELEAGLRAEWLPPLNRI